MTLVLGDYVSTFIKNGEPRSILSVLPQKDGVLDMRLAGVEEAEVCASGAPVFTGTSIAAQTFEKFFYLV